MNITVWCENYKQMREGRVKEAYPIGMGETIAAFLEKAGNKTTVVLQNEGDDGAGLTDEILESTDVLFWWGHCYHGKVSDELVKKIMADKEIAAKFQKDPVATLEDLLDVDLPNDQIMALADFIKAKIGAEKLGNALGGLKGLFGK